MGNEAKFCTCTDLKCPNHPTNHDKGCTPCITEKEKPDIRPEPGNTEKDSDSEKKEYRRKIISSVTIFYTFLRLSNDAI